MATGYSRNSDGEPALRFSVGEVMNAINTLTLLADSTDNTDSGGWIHETREAMTAGEEKCNRLVMYGFHYALLPERPYSRFPDYLAALEATDPKVLRERMLRWYWAIPARTEEWALPRGDRLDEERILKSPEVYLEFLKSRFSESCLEIPLETEAFHLLRQPDELKRAITAHMDHMWRRYLAPEWEKRKPLLEAALAVLTGSDWQGADVQTVLRATLGRQAGSGRLASALTKAEEVILIPSPHTGTRYSRIWIGKQLYLFFCPREPAVPGSGLSREAGGVLAVQLAALSDATRLAILELIAARGPLSSQEIIFLIGVSQSAASRHLKQLSTAGFLTETRFGGGKRYRLNHRRFEETAERIALLGRED